MDYSEHRPETFEYRGKWVDNWFSNMAPCPVEIDGIIWPSTENYYQSMKCIKPEDVEQFVTCNPSKSKQLGRKVKIRADWEKIKYDVMLKAVRAKFAIPEQREKLLATGSEEIIEWNNWGDKIWGVTISDNQGQNLLGKALMQVRAEINSTSSAGE